MVWLALATRPPREPEAFEVLDVLLVPELTGGRTLIVGLCGKLSPEAPARPEAEDLVTDDSIIAVGRFRDVAVLVEIDRAWQAVLEEQKIVPIGTEGIGCLNELYEVP